MILLIGQMINFWKLHIFHQKLDYKVQSHTLKSLSGSINPKVLGQNQLLGILICTV